MIPNSSGPQILILSASVGSGHLRAAEALEIVLRKMVPQAVVRNVDVLALATDPFRRCYGQMYLDLIKWAPQFLGYIYSLMDRPRPAGREHWYKLRVALERANLRPLLYLLQSQPWDLVINTFFLPAEVVASLKQQGRFSAPQVMVTTDFETHRNWVAQPCEHYFTATEEAALYLHHLGVPRGAATATGIPIHPVFSEPKDRAACMVRQGLLPDRPVLLLLAGGHGVGPLADLYRALLNVEVPASIVVVTGYNAEARRELGTIDSGRRHRVQILGYTGQMDELMAAADLIVTKPGGLTTSEALARGAGMVIVDPVPGQEERNSDFLLENGAAIKVNHILTLPFKVSGLLRDRPRLEDLKSHARRLGRPRAAFDIVERSLALLAKPLSGRPTEGGNGAHVGNGSLHADRVSVGSPPAQVRPGIV